MIVKIKGIAANTDEFTQSLLQLTENRKNEVNYYNAGKTYRSGQVDIIVEVISNFSAILIIIIQSIMMLELRKDKRTVKVTDSKGTSIEITGPVDEEKVKFIIKKIDEINLDDEVSVEILDMNKEKVSNAANFG